MSAYRRYLPSGLPFPEPSPFALAPGLPRAERFRLRLKPHADSIFFIGFALGWSMVGITLGFFVLMPLAFWARDNSKSDGILSLVGGTLHLIAFMVLAGVIFGLIRP